MDNIKIYLDDRFLRYKNEHIHIISPIDFLFLKGALDA